ncbi:MAG: hypothetical protein GF331_05590 [Chitinivibrionales bacterium]|nr:hypothetical protein [Chitinivibrionales bacterium]
MRSALGTVIWPYSWPEEHELGQLVARCRTLQTRLIVLDQTGRLPHPGQIAPGMNGVRCYSLSQSEYDGYDVAMHVLQRGHRRAAFLTHEARAPWSRRRQDGVLSAFAAYGETRGIRQLPSVRDPVIFRSPEVVAFMNAHDEFLKSHGLAVQGASSLPTKPYQFVADEAVRDFFLRSAMAKQLEPVFERALADRRTTVWICASDDIAFAALHFLSARKARVPADISLVGFDDSRLAMHYRFSSYNFNMHGLAAEMVDWILRGSTRRENGTVRRVEGFVNDRGTVATNTRRAAGALPGPVQGR